jgi:2-succinyl-6-hydroxy-2,4-cyclohexadiene-1-carboxylate synthase
MASHPEGAGRRLVLVHGFTQTGASLAPLAERLGGTREVVTVDLPGHGSASELRADLPTAARLLGEAGGTASYAGYSLGGRTCLRLAVDRPDLVRSLALIGASPGIADQAERHARRAADEALAEEIERDGVPAFLDRWLAQPLFATLPADAAGREARLANTASGLAAALRDLGTGAQEPLWDRLAALRMPMLLIAGELDPKFTAIARRMADLIGSNARTAVIPGAGHAAHLERPAAVAAVLEAFLSGAERSGEPETEREQHGKGEL